jgi:mannan endo-1,4-beta-mannosidase
MKFSGGFAYWLTFVLMAGFVVLESVLPVQHAFALQAKPLRQSQTALQIDFAIDLSQPRSPISPFIYGSNRVDQQVPWVSVRLGGNRWTGYNWENNASNAGSDWFHSNDDFVCWFLSCPDSNQPAAALHTFLNMVQTSGGHYGLLTLPMAGYVAADKNGEVGVDQVAPSSRWKNINFNKPAPYETTPNLGDEWVYVDELVAHLVSEYGESAASAVRRGYSLDNEPDLWSYTHPRLHPSQTTVSELIQRNVALASAVKSVDPSAEIFAPVHYGFWGMMTLQDAPDWFELRNGYAWFVDYYLEQMHLHSVSRNLRLLDVFDFHWYPEAQGCGKRILWSEVGDECLQWARMQAPRSLWDETYREDSWIGQWFDEYLPLLPRLQSSIQTYYPGTKLALTEFSYGAENHISGGIAVADVLGILGKYSVYLATFYPLEENSDYVRGAYQIYRNYDGQESSFGNISVWSQSSDIENASIYAAIHDLNVSQLHLIVVNRNLHQAVQGNFSIESPLNYHSMDAWILDQESPNVRMFFDNKQISSNRFLINIPPLTVLHLVLQSAQAVPLNRLYLPLIHSSSP